MAAGGVQADPKGPAQTDFFRLLTGAQGTMGVVTWAAVKCELVPAAHEYVFAAAAALDEFVDFTYRLDRLRLGDEVLIVSAAYLARLLEGSGATVDPDALPAWTLVLGLGGREHYAAERVAVQKQDAAVLAGEFGLTLRASVPGAATADIAAALAGCCAAPWKLAAEGACADVFFLTTLGQAPAFTEIAHIVAAAHGYAAQDVGVYVQPQHQGVTHHVEFSLPYDASVGGTREDMKDLTG